MITLRPPVKAALLYQPVKRIVGKLTPAAVLVGQRGDASGKVVLTARQPALRGADRLSPRIVLCLAPVPCRVIPVRSPAALYYIRVSWPCASFTRLTGHGCHSGGKG